MNYFEWLVAWRYMRSKQKDQWISIIYTFSLMGISIGVMVLIIVTSVMNGFHEELLNKILGNGGHISIHARDDSISDYNEIIDNIKKEFCTQTKVIVPSIEKQAVIAGIYNTRSIDRNVAVFLKAMKIEDIQRTLSEYLITLDDELTDELLENGIILGSKVADNLGLDLGDEVKLLSTETMPTILGNIPRFKKFKIIGIFELGLYDYDSTVVYLSLKNAQNIYLLKDKISNIDIYLHDPEISDKLLPDIYDLVNLPITDWKRSSGHFFESIRIERNVMFLILAMIILVAAFNIISSMIMLAQEKRKNIAMMKVMGATTKNIRSIFFICGASVGLLGTFFGVLIGLLISLNIDSIKSFLFKFSHINMTSSFIQFLLDLPFIVEAFDVIIISILSLSLTMIATLIPAIRASNQDPATIIRYDDN